MRRAASRAGGLAATAGLLVLLAVAAAMLLPPLLGFERYVITGDSMGDSIPRGSIVFEEVVPVRQIGVGDVITVRPPGHRALVTHRVAWIGRGGEFRTRGDANPAPDPWRFRLDHPTQARVVAHVPLAGYAVAALAVRGVRIVAIGLPALAIAFWAFAGAWRGLRPAAE